jgi:hypothetical protein
MSPNEENRLFDLTQKQKKIALNTLELKELLRLTHKKARETAVLNRVRPLK